MAAAFWQIQSNHHEKHTKLSGLTVIALRSGEPKSLSQAPKRELRDEM
jgi:hypothetical protein